MESSVDLGKGKHYLKHCSATFKQMQEQAKLRREEIFLNKKRINHIQEVEHELEQGLGKLDARLALSLTEEQQILNQQQHEQVLTKDIQAKLKDLDEKLKTVLVVKGAREMIKHERNEAAFHKRREHLEKEIKLKVGSPTERVAAIKDSLQAMREHLKHIKKNHPDQNQVQQIQKRIGLLRLRLAKFEKRSLKLENDTNNRTKWSFST